MEGASINVCGCNDAVIAYTLAICLGKEIENERKPGVVPRMSCAFL